MARQQSPQASLRRVSEELLGGRAELADELVGAIHDRVPEYAEFGGPELWEAVRDSCLANLETGLEAIAGDRRVPEQVPRDARELALITARLGLPLGALLRTYRIGHAIVWERMFELLEAEPVDAPARREAIAAASAYLFDHVDHVSAMVTDEYTAERDRFLRSREQRRTQLVRAPTPIPPARRERSTTTSGSSTSRWSSPPPTRRRWSAPSPRTSTHRTGSSSC